MNYIRYHVGKTLGKIMGLGATIQLMQDKDDILVTVGKPTPNHNELLMNMPLCTQSHPADARVVT